MGPEEIPLKENPKAPKMVGRTDETEALNEREETGKGMMTEIEIGSNAIETRTGENAAEADLRNIEVGGDGRLSNAVDFIRLLTICPQHVL